jgi:hypothetical protein
MTMLAEQQQLIMSQFMVAKTTRMKWRNWGCLLLLLEDRRGYGEMLDGMVEEVDVAISRALER